MKFLQLFAAFCIGWVGFAAPPGLGDFVSTGVPASLPPALAKSLGAIQTKRLASHIAFLADPRREGRGLGSRGLEATGRYVVGHLQKAGLPPLGPSYFQVVPLRQVSELGGELRIETSKTSVTWKHGVSCLLPELEPQVIAAPVVFAGYGIRETSLGHDDFRDLDVKGKVVLVQGGLPPGAQWQRPEFVAKYTSAKFLDRFAARVELLDQLGAKAVIGLDDDLEAQVASLKGEPFFRPEAGAPITDEPPLIRVSSALAKNLLTDGKLAGAVATLRTSGKVSNSGSRNVLAVLRGADPKVNHEAILLGAHMDHLGMRGGVLHPGADDNASGVAALLEIARTFAAQPTRPRRTVIFAFWTGEEDGKFGSGHYVRHPRWPLAKTTAYLNLDMIGHPWTAEEIRKLVMEADSEKGGAFLANLAPGHFAEPVLADWAPELAPILVRAGQCTGMALHLDRTDGRSGGSDYRDFARARVPFVRFFGNYFPEYHQPGDTATSLDSAQVQRMARLAFATAWLLAEK